MNLILEKYNKQTQEWPEEGQHIMAQYDDKKIIVYQAYNISIGDFASKNKYFGGEFSLTRMTWIKPNFLWMMYRCGWGTKDENQTTTLAIHLKLSAFERYIRNAVYSSYKSEFYNDISEWQSKVKDSSIRLQWDPDHDPFGNKLNRRAIQIGLRNEFAKSFAKDDILDIENITEYVKEQYQNVINKDLNELATPHEKPFIFKDESLNQFLKLSK